MKRKTKFEKWFSGNSKPLLRIYGYLHLQITILNPLMMQDIAPVKSQKDSLAGILTGSVYEIFG